MKNKTLKTEIPPSFRINPDSEIPKYKQVESLIIELIESGFYKKDRRIPSINQASVELLLSRSTIEKAYLLLKKQEILVSTSKGYFVKKPIAGRTLKIALILNKLSNYKNNLYNSLIKTLGDKAVADVYIYNFNLKTFEGIINKIHNNYDYFIILPHFKDGEPGMVQQIVKLIPDEKVLIIDHKLPELKHYAAVYQEFEADIREAMTSAVELLLKYKRLNLFFNYKVHFPDSICRGFIIFCQIHNFEYRILEIPLIENIEKNEAYLTVSDDHLYELIRIIRKRNWTAGKEIGILSYNENPAKELLCNGISTVSADHELIGKIAATLILKNNFKQVKSPFRFTSRNSL